MRKDFRMVHCADLHLSALTGEDRSADAFLTFRRILDFTDEMGASLLLIAGDLFDSVYAPESLVKAVQTELARCKAQVLICGGNHDYYALGAPLCAQGYPGNVRIFPAGGITRCSIPALSVTVYGRSFDAPHEQSSFLSAFCCPDDGSYQIGLFHGDVTGHESVYAPMSLARIDGCGFDYLALGHQHAASILPTASKTVASYPGMPQARRFSDGYGGVNLITVENGVTTLTHHDLCVRPYLSFSVEVNGCSNDSQLAQMILQAAKQMTEPQKSACRITLTGSRENGYHIDHTFVRQLLREDFYLLELKDETVSPVVEAELADYSLQRLFLQQIAARLDACRSAEQRELVTLARKYGLQAFYGEVDIDAD